MKYTQGLFPIIKKKAIARETYDLTVLCPQVTAAAKAGQFVNIRVDGFTLRRPISICSIDREKGTIRLVFEVRGKGTAELARLEAGGLIDIIAPLGGGAFKLLDGSKRAITVGGGIGVPPMLGVAEHYGESCTAICGFRSAANAILQEDFTACGTKTILCTDDGTAGRKGFVTDALREEAQSEKPDIIYACGPSVMLRKVIAIADELGIECQVSLEERMGCGVGACLVCACRTIRDGKEYYAHVCKDGPVFDSKEVLFDE